LSKPASRNPGVELTGDGASCQAKLTVLIERSASLVMA